MTRPFLIDQIRDEVDKHGHVTVLADPDSMYELVSYLCENEIKWGGAWITPSQMTIDKYAFRLSHGVVVEKQWHDRGRYCFYFIDSFNGETSRKLTFTSSHAASIDSSAVMELLSM